MTAPGGQAGMSSRIENYLGFPMGISGAELTQRAIIQAEKFGASLTAPCTVASLGTRAGHLVARLSDGSEVAGRAVIAATGASYRRLEAARLGDFEGNGVYYAATEMEARMCGTSPVVVVGGGNSAGQAAIFLSQGGCAVTLVIRGADLGKDMSRYLIERIEADPHITLQSQHERRRAATETRRCERCISVARTAPTDSAAPGCSPSSARTLPRGGSTAARPLTKRGFVLTDLSLSPEQLGDDWRTLGTDAAAVRDEPSRPLRRRRPALRLHQACGGCGG